MSLFLELNHRAIRDQGDFDVGRFAPGRLCVVNILPDGGTGMCGHRLVETSGRQGEDHIEHFLRGETHGPPTIKRRLGEGGNTQRLHLGLDLGQRVMRLPFMALRRLKWNSP